MTSRPSLTFPFPLRSLCFFLRDGPTLPYCECFPFLVKNSSPAWSSPPSLTVPRFQKRLTFLQPRLKGLPFGSLICDHTICDPHLVESASGQDYCKQTQTLFFLYFFRRNLMSFPPDWLVSSAAFPFGDQNFRSFGRVGHGLFLFFLNDFPSRTGTAGPFYELAIDNFFLFPFRNCPQPV